MSKPWDKNLPQAIHIRKFVLGLIIGVITFIVGVSITGLIYLSHKNSEQSKPSSNNSDTVQKVADDSTTSWYKNDASLQPVQKINPQSNHQKPAIVNANLLGQNVPPASTQGGSSDDLQKAMKASISTNQITTDQAASGSVAGNNASTNPAVGSNSTTSDDQNMQGEKKAFLQINGQPNPDDYLNSSIQNPQSPYEVQAGSIIPAILISGINSDLPGGITAQVRSNVYDSISGNYLLIPQGAKLTGIYDSQIVYGQARVLIVWNRIILPNGQSIDLQGMPGIDLSGYAGFHDQVNNHYVKMFGSVLLMSVMSAGAQLSQPQQSSNNPYAAPSVGQTLAQSLGTNIANTGTMIAQKDLNIQPTLVIRPGYEFNVSVTKDMVFPGIYSLS